MTFTSDDLLTRFDENTYRPLQLRNLDGGQFGSVETFKEFNNLALMEAICGIGSRSRIRHLRLTCPVWEIDERQADMERTAKARIKLAPLEDLMKMVASRKTTYRERIDLLMPDGAKAVMIYQHKGMRLGRG
jgi:hypothetical protein